MLSPAVGGEKHYYNTLVVEAGVCWWTGRVRRRLSMMGRVTVWGGGGLRASLALVLSSWRSREAINNETVMINFPMSS